MFKYFPHTSDDIRNMLSAMGIESLEALFADIPESIRLRKDYALPAAMSEIEIRRFMSGLSQNNRQKICFTGAGVYDHYVPAIIPKIVERSEYLTSYTPYQAEVSQGTLSYIFEYQTMMARLTGMAVSNASMYDGSTATAEAAIMACAVAKKADTVIISESVDPKVIEVVKTYAHFNGFNLKILPHHNGATDKEAVSHAMNENNVAGLIVQQPNYFGIIEDFSGLSETCHTAKALFIINSIASDLSILKTPGDWGADIAVGEAQSLGVPMSWGGPYIGYFCTTEKLMRKMPGRIVGQTVDTQGRRCFVLTLQAREQHIRRQRATSNICSNESLLALWVTIYMALMGKKGLVEATQQSCDNAHYLYDQLIGTSYFQPAFPGKEFLNEFCLMYKGNSEKLQQRWLDEGFFGGISVAPDTLMFAVTEQRSKEKMDKFVKIAKDYSINEQ